jgi:hypothetical protein
MESAWDVPHGVVDAYPSTDGDGQPVVVCYHSKAMVAHNVGLQTHHGIK